MEGPRTVEVRLWAPVRDTLMVMSPWYRLPDWHAEGVSSVVLMPACAGFWKLSNWYDVSTASGSPPRVSPQG